MILTGDCIEQMKTLPANSVDAVVTDPPYGWRFMGKAWDGADIEKTILNKARAGDRFEEDSKRIGKAQSAGLYDNSQTANQSFQEWTKLWAIEALRVLKPGGHMLVFCGPRTYHRMASGVEDADFEVRDQLQWLFGSGFPKSHNISKAIDKLAGAKGPDGKRFNAAGDGEKPNGGSKFRSDHPEYVRPEGITPDAKTWDGSGSALKPANEPIVLARKPLEKGLTLAQNVLKYGTGGLNIDGSRIGTEEKMSYSTSKVKGVTAFSTGTSEQHAQGRWPANIILDESAAEMLDEQSGFLHKAGNKRDKLKPSPGDSGGASRFFYVAKASKSERGEGNTHPTVKPIKLMEYLIKLITPPNGTVLDPFMGSGSTCVAAKRLGFNFIGCEMNEEYVAIAEKRIGVAK